MKPKTKTINPQKPKEWEKKFENRFLPIAHYGKRPKDLTEEIELFISQLLSTQKADLKREMGERIWKIGKPFPKDVFVNKKYELARFGFSLALQKVMEEIEKL